MYEKVKEMVFVLRALCVLLTAACVYDYRDGRIPNGLIMAAAALGIFLRSRAEGAWGAVSFLGGAAAVMAVLYPFFKIGGLGAGDVKLFGVTAGYLPFGKIPYFLFHSLLIAAVFSLIKMWKEKNFAGRLRCLAEYIESVMKSGPAPYPENGEGRGGTGIRLSGPVLISVLLYLGGVR